MSTTMRCKLRVNQATVYGNGDNRTLSLKMGAVWEGSCEAQAASENAVFGRNSPYGEFNASILNPALVDSFKEGDEFYVDFVKVMK